MSLILDALKKSEDERVQQAGSDLSRVAGRRDAPRMPRWLWLLGGLLLINALVLAALLLRDPPRPVAQDVAATATGPRADAGEPAAVAGDDFAAQLAAARASQAERPSPDTPLAEEPVYSATSGSTISGSATSGSAISPAATPDSGTAVPRPAGNASAPAGLPDYLELRTRGDVELPDLHLDIHVYGEQPDARFVFINMQKLREGERLEGGTELRAITPDGVVLRHAGRDFVLSRR